MVETQSTTLLLIMRTLQRLPMPTLKRHIMAASTMKRMQQNITMKVSIMETM
ncbi:hypothetical protein DPMN_152132 [Dreissena polymorpha]|uniref:Uncharacterized protein n=1 Tax=Dreissena polymorpha TaxID=45954 RepID=A0A9D4J822_DREPO|nr:hypothetical protein DPMN_152132 [Dreissena polymorpha]